MARRPRDYRQEYELRVARGTTRGLTRAQARGHARYGEVSAGRNVLRPPRVDARLETGLAHFLGSGNLTAAAKSSGISAERLRRLVHEQRLGKRERGRLRPVVREMVMASRGREITVRVGFDAASRIGSYLNAREQFLSTNDVLQLAPFEGQTVVDLAGKSHPFETDPNTLYELSFAGRGSFEQVYRLTIL